MFASGHLVKLKRPLCYKDSVMAFADMYDKRDLAVPCFAWSISTETDVLMDETMLAELAPWQPSRTRKTSHLPAIADADRMEEHDETHELGATMMAPTRSSTLRREPSSQRH